MSLPTYCPNCDRCMCPSHEAGTTCRCVRDEVTSDIAREQEPSWGLASPRQEMVARFMFGEPPATEFDALWRLFIDNMNAVHNAKRADYTGGNVDPLYNYARAAEAMGVTTTQAMVGRMQEKVTRLAVLARPGTEAQVQTEALEDTCLDIAIIAGLIASARS